MKKAFTLIELLVVVLIIGILSAIALPQYKKAVTRANAVQMFVVFNAYSQAIDRWILANGEDVSSRIRFTGSEGSGGLDIDGYTHEDTHNDRLGKVTVQAWISSTNGGIAIYGDNTTILGRCSVQFQRQHGSTQWNMTAITVWTEGGTSASVAGDGECEELKQFMCQYWKANGNGLGRSPSKSQCEKYGITLQLAE